MPQPEIRTVNVVRYVTPLREGGSLDLPARFRWLTASRSTIIQHSNVHTGLCENPESVLNDLFSKYVL